MKRIIRLTESDLTRIVRRVIREGVTDLEPTKGEGSGFGVYFKEGQSTLSIEAKQLIVNDIKVKLRSSMSTIDKFYNDRNFPIPKFIQVGSGTSSTGTRDLNANLGQKRINSMVECVYMAFEELGDETGDVVGQDYIKKFLTTNTDFDYDPSKLKTLYDADKSKPKKQDRYAFIIISPLSTKGKTSDQIDYIEDFVRAARGWNINPDEEKIAFNVCQLQTYSDIQQLDNRLRNYGGLEIFLNDTMNDEMSLWSDSASRKKTVGCLNNAAMNSGKGNIAKSVGDKISIILTKLKK